MADEPHARPHFHRRPRRQSGPTRRFASVVAATLLLTVAGATAAAPVEAAGSPTASATTITSPMPPRPRVGEPYAHAFTANPPPARWELVSGGFPDGLVFDPAAATISGTPTTPGPGRWATVAAHAHRPVTAVATGLAHTCARLDDAATRCWGANSYGQLGLGDTAHRGDQPGELGDPGGPTPAVDLGPGRTATAIAAGAVHSCALLDNGLVKCWGAGSSGQLGQGDRTARGDQPDELGALLPPVTLGPGRSAVAVAAGARHTCALLDNGGVKCWGANTSGQLGQGDRSARGDDPGEMGVALPPVDLGAGRTAVAVDAGDDHTCALLDNGGVKCWGANTSGQLGQGDRSARGDEPGELGYSLPVVNLGAGRHAVAVTAGAAHTCVLLDDDQVKCWGENSSGQLGQGDRFDRSDGPGELGDHLPAVSLGSGRHAVAVSAGSVHTCAALDDGSAKCWGGSLAGQLGQGDTSPRGDQPGELGDALDPVDLGPTRAVAGIAAGEATTCVATTDGPAVCWGRNTAGQLGQGDVTQRGDGPGEPGSALPPIDLGTVLGATQSVYLSVAGVHALSPAVGMTTGGTTVTLTGYGLSSTNGVRFGPTPAASFSVVDDRTVVAVAPARPAGVVNVWLDRPGASTVNLPATHFTYLPPPTSAPAVTAVSPVFGPTEGGNAVTVTGRNFLSVTNVSFGRDPAASFTIVDNTTIIAVAPARSEGLVSLRVTNPFGTNWNTPSSWYEYRVITGPAPSITAMSPTTGPVGGGTTVTITGSSFTASSTVAFGSTPALAVTVIDPATIVATAPPHAAALVNVRVTTENGASVNQMASWYLYA